MLPILFKLGPITVYTYGIFLVLAFFWGMYYLWKLVQLTSFKEENIFDGLFTALLGGAIFGRLVYVILHFPEFGFNFLKIILFNGFPGFSYWGFVIGFFLALFLFSRNNKIDYAELVDYLIPPFVLSLAIVKIGGFFGGIEAGTQTNFFLSLSYAGLEGQRHLTPLYEGLLMFIAVVFHHNTLFSIRRNNVSPGFNLLLMLWFLSGIYAAFDWIREGKMLIQGLSMYGIFSVIILLTVTLYFIYYFRAVILRPLQKSSKK